MYVPLLSFVSNIAFGWFQQQQKKEWLQILYSSALGELAFDYFLLIVYYYCLSCLTNENLIAKMLQLSYVLMIQLLAKCRARKKKKSVELEGEM